MAGESQTEVVVEIARLNAAIERAATITEDALTGQLTGAPDGGPDSPAAEQRELRRQVAALRDRVAGAQRENGDLRAVRAELATLLFFAKTLQADADQWRATLDARIRELERQRAAARRERERLAAERAKLVRRRNDLQSTIVQTAARVAQRDDGECRRTLPVFTLGEGLTVCSVSVLCPRRGVRVGRHWLVTLNRARDDVLIRSQ